MSCLRMPSVCGGILRVLCSLALQIMDPVPPGSLARADCCVGGAPEQILGEIEYLDEVIM
eukprot:CAMPEP_0172574330 /NCGR_PEP_ID=MMETSP1067-20121228/136647_1 /TAXON_ID=265564 ORGANISM="Thalassiosira punctigera, Strain Tpunct2005C2" /NCGR_SAMPLE_ID=MMETSP1067 /ASSEMBLY_ACC=CAM_ASM_000444 /LENGTH=59 /DNA_ID=CAMNT_0013366953 /DNA_START=904 /DNA_END=1083 /DNA_ORIENTATION=+